MKKTTMPVSYVDHRGDAKSPTVIGKICHRLFYNVQDRRINNQFAQNRSNFSSLTTRPKLRVASLLKSKIAKILFKRNHPHGRIHPCQ